MCRGACGCRRVMGAIMDDRFTTRVGETHPDWSGDPVPGPLTDYQQGYNDALGDLAKWLRDAGY